jgi:hypothetical protein
MVQITSSHSTHCLVNLMRKSTLFVAMMFASDPFINGRRVPTCVSWLWLMNQIANGIMDICAYVHRILLVIATENPMGGLVRLMLDINVKRSMNAFSIVRSKVHPGKSPDWKSLL